MDDYSPQPAQRSPLPPPEGDPFAVKRLLLVLTGLVVVMVVFYALPRFVENLQYSSTRGRERARADVAKQQLQQGAGEDLGRVSSLVARSVSPSVVHINTVRRGRMMTAFGRVRDFEARGEGSGVIVDAQGFVVTNNHVVENASQINVRLSDGRSVPGSKVGVDPQIDLAVLKIDASGLVAAEWGDSDQLEPGSLVWAIGNPFGLDRSVTFGIVSAKNRHTDAQNPLQDFLQTDAAVNPGNSGGPLVSAEGKVVGINTAIVGRAYQGISFSIPSNTARQVYEELRAHQKVSRAWLGVALEDLSEDLMRELQLKDSRGVLIFQVVPGGPAEEGGFKVGDVVVEWNGQPVDNRATLSVLVARTPVGSQARAVVVRGGRRIELRVTVRERPARLEE